MNAVNAQLGFADALVWSSAFGAASAAHDIDGRDRRIIDPRSGSESTADASTRLLTKLHYIAARAVLRSRGQTAEPTPAQVAALHDFIINTNATAGGGR